MNYLKISNFDTANGLGIGVVLWVSGCSHHCPQCHNPQTWDYNVGKEFTEETFSYLLESLDRPYINRLTFSGGDPLSLKNRKIVKCIAKRVKEKFPNLKVWCYTGYTFEELPKDLLEYFDILVDGKFEINKKDVTLNFRGSSNQRLIDLTKTLKVGKVVEWENNNVS